MSGLYPQKEKGVSIIGTIFLIFVIILVLGFFGISIRGAVESPESQENLSYVWRVVSGFWNDYLKGPAVYIWKDVIVEIFWRSFIENMRRIRDGQPTSIEIATPASVPY